MADTKPPPPADRRVEYVDLDSIVPAPRNAKAHATTEIRASISHFGIAELPLLDERTGRLVAGHGRVDDLRTRRDDGDEPPAGISLTDDGRWLVPVLRGWASRSDEDAEAYLIASNQLTILGGWDDTDLATMLSDLNDVDRALLEITGFTEDDLAELLAADGGGGPAGRTDPDDVPDPPEEAVTQPGDVWLLGPHRLLCGDANNPDDVKLVLDGLGDPGIIYTDPPYGINAVPKDGGVSRGKAFGSVGSTKGAIVAATRYAAVTGDNSPDTAADAYRLLSVTYPRARHVWWGANHYAASAGLPDASCWLVWDKDNGASDFADVEMAWSNHPGAARLLRHMWHGMLRASERGKRVHPTQKPVALAEWAFTVVDSKSERRVVLDVFGGSGSTLIAANRTSRTAALVEMEPLYADVICRRWQEHTGDMPILEATGEAYDFTPELSADPSAANP